MARYRSRRTSRRSASQTAASLLALALPAPIQRVADTRIGPLLMLVGIPTMLALGYLNIDWSNGTPNLSIDSQRASELRNATRETINNFETQGGLQGLGQAASELINHAQGYANQYGANQYNNPYAGNTHNGTTYPQSPTYAPPTTQAQSQWPTRNTGAAFPSTQPAASQSMTAQQDWRYNSQPTYTQPTAQAQQTGYTQSGYAQQGYSQPNYAATNGYSGQAVSPSDHQSAATYQQQLLYQQQLYEQQLRQQQYQQWLAQQQAAQSQPRAPAANYQQTDAYGRPVTTGNWQPSAGYASPTTQGTQYGASGPLNYNQGALPANRGYR